MTTSDTSTVPRAPRPISIDIHRDTATMHARPWPCTYCSRYMDVNTGIRNKHIRTWRRLRTIATPALALRAATSRSRSCTRACQSASGRRPRATNVATWHLICWCHSNGWGPPVFHWPRRGTRLASTHHACSLAKLDAEATLYRSCCQRQLSVWPAFSSPCLGAPLIRVSASSAAFAVGKPILSSLHRASVRQHPAPSLHTGSGLRTRHKHPPTRARAVLRHRRRGSRRQSRLQLHAGPRTRNARGAPGP